MNREDQKKVKTDYKQRLPPMGVFQIRNTTNDKLFVAAGRDVKGIINRHRFQLTIGKHANKSLQSDWNRLGPESIAFEILEELVPPNNPRFDQAKELEFMEKMWLDKLQPFSDRGYNEPKLTRAEKLRRISANNLDKL